MKDFYAKTKVTVVNTDKALHDNLWMRLSLADGFKKGHVALEALRLNLPGEISNIIESKRTMYSVSFTLKTSVAGIPGELRDLLASCCPGAELIYTMEYSCDGSPLYKTNDPMEAGLYKVTSGCVSIRDGKYSYSALKRMLKEALGVKEERRVDFLTLCKRAEKHLGIKIGQMVYEGGVA